ncbi:MAG TPA: hypothetical protein VI457_03120 [Methylococcaceae bacterium]|nr:hypothetical protein [Methylococcaceae bacterium]
MKAFQSPLLLSVLLVCMALTTACTGHNDNPSQQITTERVGCPVATDFFAVYFTVHVQPSDESPDARVTRELFRPYCHDLPKPGKVFFTADLVGNELKATPIGIEVVEEEFAGGNESQSGNVKDVRTLSEVTPKRYSKGVIQTAFDLDKNGYYAIYLIRAGKGAGSEPERLRIPLNVGVTSGGKLLMTRIVTIFVITSGLALIGFVVFRYGRR